VSWETSFLAMSTAIGVDAKDALRAISTVHDPDTLKLETALASPSKTRRAQALAQMLGAIARDVIMLDLRGGA